MPRCKWCNKWVLFSLSRAGLCNDCQPEISMHVQRLWKIINDSMDIITNTKKMDTAKSRFQLVGEHLQTIGQYEMKGIAVLEQGTAETLRRCTEIFLEKVLSIVKSEYDEAVAKSELAQTTKTKIAPLSKVVVKLQKYQAELPQAEFLGKIEADLRGRVHQITLDGYLDAAAKAEFKNQKKKALVLTCRNGCPVLSALSL